MTAVTGADQASRGIPVAVAGAGYMGGGIAQVLALAGHHVVIADVDASSARSARDRLLSEAEGFEIDGLMPAGAAQAISERLMAAGSIEEAAAGSGFVIEAVPEVVGLKMTVLRRISSAVDEEAVVATNTSAIPIQALAGAVADPSRFLGVHWMNPAPFVPCVEIIPGPVTSEVVLTTIERLITRAGKVAVRVSDSPGFISNRLQFALYKEACRVVEEGLADASQVDAVVSGSFGFRLALFGPFAIADMAGLDVYRGAYETLEAAYGERFALPDIVTAALEQGRAGVKSGSGGVLRIAAQDVPALMRYRNMAYAGLSALRADLGPAPGLGTDDDQET